MYKIFLPNYYITLNYKNIYLNFIKPYKNFKNISNKYKQNLNSYNKNFFLNKLILNTIKYINIKLQIFYYKIPFNLPKLNTFIFITHTKQKSFTTTNNNITITSKINNKIKLILPKKTFKNPTKLFFQINTINIKYLNITLTKNFPPIPFI